MPSAQRNRLIQAGTASLILHLLVLLLLGQITWERIRQSTPYLGPLKVELPSMAKPPEVLVPELTREAPEPRSEPPRAVSSVEAAAPAEAVPSRRGQPVPVPSPPAPVKAAGSPDPYADLFTSPADTLPEVGRAEPDAIVESPGTVSPRRFSEAGGVRYDEAEIVDASEEDTAGVAAGDQQPDLSALDTALATRDVSALPGEEGEKTGRLPGDVTVELPVGSGEVNLTLASTLAERVGNLPSFILSDDLRRMIREEGHPVYQAEFGFIVTPEGIIKGLHILGSSGNTFLDQELRKALGVGWTFRPASGAGEAEGRVIISVKVK